VADGLDVVAVGVEDEGAVVAGVVDRAESRGAVVRATGGNGRSVEGVDLLGVANAEGDVAPLTAVRSRAWIQKNGFGPCSVSLPKPIAPSNSIIRRIPSGSRASP
jgi:hypothetical protein